MQIILKQSEIEQALRQFIGQQGIPLGGRTVDVTFNAGRGDKGITAEIDINDVANVAQGSVNVRSIGEANVASTAIGTGTVGTVLASQGAETLEAKVKPVKTLDPEPQVGREPEVVKEAESAKQAGEVKVEAGKSLFG